MINLDGLVVSERPVGETSKIITLLTRELACIDVYVRGGQKSRKSLSATQLFSYARFSLDEKTDAYGTAKYYFNSCEPRKLFYNIRLDLEKTALASYFADILKYAAVSSDNVGEVMRLTLNSLHFLNEGSRSDETIKSIFEFRLLCETGYRPDLIGCCRCYAPEADIMHFNLRTGLIECENCVVNPDSMYDVSFDRSLFYIVRYIALVEYERLFNIKPSGVYEKKLSRFTERFIEYCFGRRFDTLTYYRQIKD